MTLKLFVFCLLAEFAAVFFGHAFGAEQAPRPALAPVGLQLKWFHQFQFAGYYAAKEQGYYAAEGLDVDIRELSPGNNPVTQVLSREADFGIGDSGIIAAYANGAAIVALAAIFQHDPLVFISKRSSGIVSPYEMAGKRIMFNAEGADDAPLRAMLADAGVGRDNFVYVRHSFDNDDLIRDKVDVMSAYLSDEPFYFEQQNVPLNIINPQNYGFDFYGDILFTSRAELADHPGRAERFRRATLKGWRYALEHPEELIHLIHNRYHSRLGIEHLRHEAEQVRKLILAGSVPLGQIEAGRLRRVAKIYADLKIAPPLSDSQLESFLFDHQAPLDLSAEEQVWLQQHPVIRVGIDRDFAPYEWIDKQGRYTGMTADYLRLLEQRLKVRFDIVKDKTWPEILDMAKRGEVDMLSNAVKTPERERYLRFTQPYFHHPIIIITANSRGYVGNLEHLQGKLVAIEKGYFMEEMLTREHPEIQLVAFNGVRAALQATAAGKTDAYVGHAATAGYTIKQEGMLQLSFAGETGYYGDHSIAVIKSNPVLYGILDKALASITEQERNNIQNHWMNLKIERGLPLQTLLQYAAAVLALLLLFGYWIYRLRREIGARRASEAALRQSEAKFRAIIEASPVPYALNDTQNIIFVNRAFTETFGYTLNDIPTLADWWPKAYPDPDYRLMVTDTWQTRLQQAAKHGTAFEPLKLDIRCENGTLRHVMASAAALGESFADTHLVILYDITELKKNEEKLTLAARVFSEAHEAIVITDADGKIVDVNPTYCEITGYSRAEVLGKNPNILKSGKQSAEFYVAMWKTLLEAGHWRGEIWNRRKNGELFPELLTISALRDASGKTVNFIGLFSDITQIKHQQQALELMAHYDALTQLPNRVLFADRFKQAVARSKRDKTLLGICYLDLDGFKPVNDNYGHETGDVLLIEVAERIKNCLRDEDTVSRLGGDEFALLLVDQHSPEQLETLLARLHRDIAEPFRLGNGDEAMVTASTGVTLFPLDDGDPDTLLRHADQAMYQAKLAGRNCYRLFDPAQDQRQHHRGKNLQLIEQALLRNEFCLYYQPKVDMRSARVVGSEALIRWRHPERGILPPREFLPLIEGSALEAALGDWVIEAALRQLETWQKIGLDLQISVNIAPGHLQGKTFIKNLAAALERHPAIDSRLLELEVLESSVLVDLVAAGNTLKECFHTLGVPFALDDFGTGYSSLAHLRRLPVSTIKIDQCFVRDMLEDIDDLAIVESVVGLAHAFKRSVIAEGVESMEHGLALLNIGCSIAQGYAVAEPMPAAAVAEWVRRYRPYTEWSAFVHNPPLPQQAQLLMMQIEVEQLVKHINAQLREAPGSRQHWPMLNPKKSYLRNWVFQAGKDQRIDRALADELLYDHSELLRIAERLKHLYQDGKAAAALAELGELAAVQHRISDLIAALGQRRQAA